MREARDSRVEMFDLSTVPTLNAAREPTVDQEPPRVATL